MVSNRSASSSRISRPGSAVDLILERIGAVQANLGSVHADIGAVYADLGTVHANIYAVQAKVGAVQENIDAVQENIGAVGAAQVETREVLETVIHRLERLEASPVPKFVAGLILNPSLSNEMTAAPVHSPIILEAKVSTAPVVPRRSERLVDYRQVALQPRWPISTARSEER